MYYQLFLTTDSSRQGSSDVGWIWGEQPNPANGIYVAKSNANGALCCEPGDELQIVVIDYAANAAEQNPPSLNVTWSKDGSSTEAPLTDPTKLQALNSNWLGLGQNPRSGGPPLQFPGAIWLSGGATGDQVRWGNTGYATVSNVDDTVSLAVEVTYDNGTKIKMDPEVQVGRGG